MIWAHFRYWMWCCVTHTCTYNGEPSMYNDSWHDFIWNKEMHKYIRKCSQRSKNTPFCRQRMHLIIYRFHCKTIYLFKVLSSGYFFVNKMTRKLSTFMNPVHSRVFFTNWCTFILHHYVYVTVHHHLCLHSHNNVFLVSWNKRSWAISDYMILIVISLSSSSFSNNENPEFNELDHQVEKNQRYNDWFYILACHHYHPNYTICRHHSNKSIHSSQIVSIQSTTRLSRKYWPIISHIKK